MKRVSNRAQGNIPSVSYSSVWRICIGKLAEFMNYFEHIRSHTIVSSVCASLAGKGKNGNGNSHVKRHNKIPMEHW